MLSQFSGFKKFTLIWAAIWIFILMVYYIPDGFSGFLHYIFVLFSLSLIILSPFLYHKIKTKFSFFADVDIPI